MDVPSEQPIPGKAAYLPQLDGLRAVLASYVVIHHAFYQAWPPELYVTPPQVVTRFLPWLHFGHYAVNVFIVLSGFVLTLPVVRYGRLRGGARRFYISRFWRIVPAYYAAIALSVGLMLTLIDDKTGTHWDCAINLTWTTFLSCVGFVHDWIGHGGVNYVFWSVAVEAKIYLLFPVIVASWRRIGLLATAAFASVVVFSLPRCLRWRYGIGLSSWDTIVPWYVGLFLMGVVAAVIATSPDPRWGRLRRIPWGGLCLLGSLLVIALGYRKGTTWIYRNLDLVDLVVGSVAACGITSIVCHPGRVAQLLSTRPVVFVGTFAYSLYLIHAPLLQLIHQYLIFPLRLSRGCQFLALVGIAYPLIVLMSYGFFRLFEQPFLSRRRIEAEAIAVGVAT